MTSSYAKTPAEIEDFAVNWAPHLAASETISTSIWVVPTGITQTTASSTTTTATIWLSGGTANSCYELTSRVVTNQARTFEKTIRVYVVANQ